MGLPVLVLLESLAHWVMSRGDLAFLIPTSPGPEWNAPCRIPELVNNLDALVLQGGADVCPRAYGEEPVCQEWCGDPRRDGYELALVQEFLEQRKPILGICRGMQLLNVALGGSLYQDVPSQFPNGVCHRSEGALIQKTPTSGVHASHTVRFIESSWLQQLYQGRGQNHPVVSVHHQAVKRLGEGLSVEAVSPEDALIEAIRLDRSDQFALGLQWHPEIQPPNDPAYLDPEPILQAFRQAALQRRAEGASLPRGRNPETAQQLKS
jgi:putative glutamine amidotransferase